jgi:hypothetical protein
MMDGDNANFSQNGGARIDSWNVTIPYAVLSAYRDALRLSCLGQDYVFPKDRIIALSRHRGLFTVGLRIEHDVPLYPAFIVFWVAVFFKRTRFTLIKERLNALGYEVKD